MFDQHRKSIFKSRFVFVQQRNLQEFSVGKKTQYVHTYNKHIYPKTQHQKVPSQNTHDKNWPVSLGSYSCFLTFSDSFIHSKIAGPIYKCEHTFNATVQFCDLNFAAIVWLGPCSLQAKQTKPLRT